MTDHDISFDPMLRTAYDYLREHLEVDALVHEWRENQACDLAWCHTRHFGECNR